MANINLQYVFVNPDKYSLNSKILISSRYSPWAICQFVHCHLGFDFRRRSHVISLSWFSPYLFELCVLSSLPPPLHVTCQGTVFTPINNGFGI